MKPVILFVCVQNACRSQMAEGFARALGGSAVDVHSAGSRPSGKVNDTSVGVMRENGIDISAQRSKGFADLPTVFWSVVVTMGCGDVCPTLPAKRRVDWALPDPKEMSLDDFRGVRDDIAARVRSLLAELAK